MSTLDNGNRPDVQDQVAKLFEGTPTEADMIVSLPSQGHFYQNKQATVTITPIKFEDEKQISITLKNNDNPLSYILQRCIKDFPVNNLLLLDKQYLLLKIREISYGSEYPVEVTCPKCGFEHSIKINLGDLLVNEISKDLTDPRTIKLPKLKKDVEVRFPRVSDEQWLTTENSIFQNLWRFILKINGNSDPVFIAEVIKKLHVMDVKFIMHNITRTDLGLNPQFELDCSKCSRISKINVPINENFFLVT